MEHASTKLHSAQLLLQALNDRLDQPLSWKQKREMVEALVDDIRVEIVESHGRREAIVKVKYKFTLVENATGNPFRGPGNRLRLLRNLLAWLSKIPFSGQNQGINLRNWDNLPLLGAYFAQDSGCGRLDFHHNLVGLNFRMITSTGTELLPTANGSRSLVLDHRPGHTTQA